MLQLQPLLRFWLHLEIRSLNTDRPHFSIYILLKHIVFVIWLIWIFCTVWIPTMKSALFKSIIVCSNPFGSIRKHFYIQIQMKVNSSSERSSISEIPFIWRTKKWDVIVIKRCTRKLYKSVRQNSILNPTKER